MTRIYLLRCGLMFLGLGVGPSSPTCCWAYSSVPASHHRRQTVWLLGATDPTTTATPASRRRSSSTSTTTHIGDGTRLPTSKLWGVSSSSSSTSSSEGPDNDDNPPTSSSSSSAVTTATPAGVVPVQRRYETYVWRPNNDSGNTYNINYRVEGPIDGPPLLLVHGFGANVNHFRHQFQILPNEGYRVYAIDLLGFGASDKPSSAPYSIELFAQLVQDFIQAMSVDDPQPQPQPHNPQQWVIAGNSIGGLASLCVAAALPHRICGVVLFNCAGGMTGFRYEDVPWYIRPLLFVVQTVVLGPYFGPRFFANFKTRDNVESILKQQGVYGNPTNVNEELIDILLGPSDDDGAEQVFLKVFAGPPGPTPESVLPNVQCPILGLWGSADPVRFLCCSVVGVVE